MATLGLIALSCTKSESKDSPKDNLKGYEMEFKGKMMNYVESFRIDGDTIFPDSIYAQNSVSIYWIDNIGSIEMQDLHSHLLKSIFNNDSLTLLQNIKSFLKDSIGYEGNGKLASIDALPAKVYPMFAANKTAAVTTFTDKLLVYTITSDGYTGGAHGWTKINYLNYNLKDKCPITFSDLFIKGKEKEILSAIKVALLLQNGATTDKEMGDKGFFGLDSMKVTKDFALSKNTVTFTYGQYELGCFALGIVNIPVPISNLAEYLTPKYKEFFADQIN